MPPRRRRFARLPDYPVERLALDDYVPQRAVASATDPAAGFGYSGWNAPSKPLTGAQKLQVFGGTGTQVFAGLISDNQLGMEEEPEEWRGEQRWRTIQSMWRSDGQVAAILNVCILPLLQATVSINPASESDEDVAVAQAFSDNLLHGLEGGLPRYRRQFLLGRFRDGHYLAEKVWKNDSGGTLLRKIAIRPPATVYRWFPTDDDELDRIMQRVWLQDPGGVTGQWRYPLIPAEKLVLSPRNMEGNDYRGISLLRHMWLHYYFKHKLYLIDGIAAERNGMGVPDMEQPPVVVQQSDRDRAEAALERFRVGETAFILRPNGYKFTLTGVSGQVRDIQPSIQHHDLLMARSALAHFINLDAYGQVLISEQSQSLFLMAEEAEAAEECEVQNALIREWCDYNYEGIDRYPTMAVTGISGERDLDAILKGVSQLAIAGLLTPNVETENQLRDDLDFPALPAEATPAGGGAVSVDPDSQRGAGLPPEGAVPTVVPGATADQALGFKPAFSSGRLGERAIHLSGRPLRHQRFTVRMSGAYREEREGVRA